MKTIKAHLPQSIKQYPLLFLLAAFCIGILLVRAKITQSVFFFFLIWNLFLAYTPLGLVLLMRSNIVLIEKRVYFYPLFLGWLAVLPNAPYIITDFIHLKRELSVPVWFDVLLLISFSASGMLFGLASMKEMFSILTVRFSSNAAWLVMAATCLLSGFGIYVGRFLRYNSWDIVQKPFSLSADIITSLTGAATYKPAWGITLGFGTLMFLLFHLYQTPEK
jgi:uncharacterized membrane protein